ncbi:DNA polymerase I [Notoacmeibacter ruber]|uniref:DNA polymerase I n=1 Tax=Notoacmeibacter ruber TaxID=2670375 RepID=A0A3L7J8D9_9HYPH|nr:DNA polymerase I [Notoacmeibacter ruber]RLQ86933.1 DNA polymerase I [Notoacmeibacter ruber]
MKKGDHLFLVDGSAYIFRAYHALPPLTRKSDGLPVGAVSGFCNMLWKLLRNARDTEVGVTPTHFAVIFDYSSKTFRNELYGEYKANRSAPPEDLVPQFGLIREATRAFDVACIEQEGFEADDIIATYCRLACEAGGDTTIISSDKDLMQLVGPTVGMYDPMKDKEIGVDEVIEKFGVRPDKMIELQALTGDSIDNVPGVPGIGPKTAAQLLEEFGDLDTLLAQAETIKQKKRRENLIEHADNARLSRELVRLRDDVDLELPLDALTLSDLNGPKLIGFLKTMQFTTLTKRVADQTEADASAIDAADVKVEWESAHGPDLDPGEGPSKDDVLAAPTEGMAPQALAEKRAAEIRDIAFDHSKYETVGTLERLRAWIAAARDQGHVAFDTETDSLDPMQAKLCGFSLAVEPGYACYVPLCHREGDGDLLGSDSLCAGQIPERDALSALRELLEDPACLKIGQNIKFDMVVMARCDVEGEPIEIVNFDDTMLISYVIEAGRTAGSQGGHGMDPLADRWLGHKPIPYKDVCGTGKNAVTFDRVTMDKATEYAAEDADITLRLWLAMKPRLTADGVVSVYERLERPLVPVIGKMERAGVSVDRQILSRLSGEFGQQAAGIEAEIYEMAGESFNIGSPKQLGDILFGRMGLPGGSKTKTGQWSTSARVLEDLAAEGHPLPRRIVDWRQLTKLKSTYTDALPGYIHPETKRVHTSYQMAATTTGRLSSSEPNLQNIPIRTSEGRKIRTAFIAEPGNVLISADYSQIELRILAHIADIPQLRQAFAEGIDIHAMTASEMFGVPVEGMPGEVRRRAKAINFGIIYGISAFGLANQLGIERSEAGEYIKRYFERFPGIRDYMDATKAFAREHGYVETLFGRRAYYPDIKSSNHSVRSFNERAAINAPIQGSAADIIRRAMIRMDGVLEKAKLNATMLLQVHDELIFELPESQAEAAIPLIRDVMENAAMPAVDMAVPLQVDAQAASNWDEAH